MGLEFLIKDGTAHYTAMCDKCDAIRNMKAPKSVKECQTFCGMVNFLSTFCKNLRQLLIPIYELTKKHARFTWTDKHQKAFDEIKQLLVKPPVLRMVSGNGFFRLESDTSRTAAGAILYQWQNNEWVLVGYHSKRLPDAVRNYGVTELELTGLLANIHGFEQKLNNNYFEAIVDHKAIDYLIKSKHEPTSTRLVTLLDRLNRYTFDLKYLEGSKLKVSDALSRLYSEEKHKLSDVIPLNFLLHFTDYQLHKESDELANKLYAHKRTKLSTKPRHNYDRQAKHKPVDRYEPSETTKKGNKEPAVAKVNDQQYASALQEIPMKSLTKNENPLKKLDRIDKPLTIKQDQQKKQVINTIREVPPEMYTPAHLLIPPQDKLSLFRKHIPKQQEIDALLKNLRKHVLHNLMVNLDTKDLIESYTKLLRYREIYNYVADGRLPGNANTQKKIAGEAANYVVVNGLLFKIAQHKESGKWTHYLLLVISEKFEANILNMYHNSLLAMHKGPYKTFLTMRKQFYFPNMLPKILRLKVPFDKSILTAAEKERLIKLMLENTAAFSIRDEIGTCPYFEVKLKLQDDKPFFVRPYNIREDQKPFIQKEMDRLEKLGIIRKGLTGYSSPVLLVKRKQQNLYRVVTDFRVLNERLERVNHAFPIVRDCLEAIGASKCEVMSVLDLRDAYHTLPLAEESQKYCGLTPYYGSPMYVYLRMGMGMSCSPALWQQFIHIIWEQLPNKERYKIIMDDILIFST